MRSSDPLEERQRRYEQMKAAKDAGKSLAQIAESFGVSRERVRQILANGSPRLTGYAGHSARNTD